MSGAVSLLARSYRVQVSTDNANWLTVYGLNDFNPEISSTTQDASDYESDGWNVSEVTMKGWKLTIKANAKATAGALDPALAMILACEDQFGDGVRVYVRWFRKDGVTGFPAYSGRAIVESATPSKTGVPDLNEYQVVLTGDGKPEKIANPYAPDAAPVVSSASPSGAAAGELVTIGGSGFTGASSVKFGSTAATEYVVQGDSSIVAVMPTGSAGSAAVTVTNATGASTAFAYTRGA